MPDHVPFGVAQIAQGFYFACKFLYAVLAEDAQSSSVGFVNRFWRKCFTDCHQRDFFTLAASYFGCCCDTFLDFRNIFRDRHKTKATKATKTTKNTKYHEEKQAAALPRSTEAEFRSAWTGEGAGTRTNEPFPSYILPTGGGGSVGWAAAGSGPPVIRAANE